MNESRLRQLLRETPLPEREGAERRGLDLVERAYAERAPVERPLLPRLALALAAATLLAGLLLSPAGAAVRDWIDDAFTDGVPNAAPALTDLPGGGKLLVQSASGPWVVQADGSRRLLGDYREATWSPHGLFVGATGARALSAIEPDGTPRWSISARSGVADPRWSPSGFRIAYRAGGELRVVRATGRRDRRLAAGVPPVPPAWFPLGLHLLAYAGDDGRVHVVDADSGVGLTSAASLPGVAGIAWAADGSRLFEWSARELRSRAVSSGKFAERVTLGAPRSLELPPLTRVLTAAVSPRGQTIAALLSAPRAAAGEARSEVVLANSGADSVRRLFTVTGGLSDLTWSPDGQRLLIGWPDADQWLFLPVDGSRPIPAVDDISGVFSPGGAGRAPFPRVEGWCCSAP
jgi:WD40 repeat protein